MNACVERTATPTGPSPATFVHGLFVQSDPPLPHTCVIRDSHARADIILESDVPQYSGRATAAAQEERGYGGLLDTRGWTTNETSGTEYRISN